MGCKLCQFYISCVRKNKLYISSIRGVIIKNRYVCHSLFKLWVRRGIYYLYGFALR